MHGLRHRSLLSKKAAPKGAGTQKGCGVDGVRSSRLNTRTTKASHREKRSGVGGQFASTGDGERFRINTRSMRAQGSNSEKSSAIAGQFASTGDGKQFRNDTRRARPEAGNLIRSCAAGGQFACSPDGGNSTRSSAAGDCGRVVGTVDANLERTSLNGLNTQTVGDDSGISQRISSNGRNSQMVGVDASNSQMSAANGLNTQMVRVDVSNSQRSGANGLNSQMVGADVGNSQRINANGLNSQLAGVDGGTSQVNCGSDGANSQLNIGSNQSPQDPPKRGRAKMCRTKYKIPPRSGKIQLEPIGHCQFKYVDYNPQGCKYPSQLGTILKREYPGVVKIYDDNGTIVKVKPAFSWNDYYWKKNREGICCAQRVKQEFWSTFTSHPRHRARAAKNLENYLVKRVTNMMYQVRLEAVKKWCHRRNEDCDDTRARTIELTEEQYLTCRVEWCNRRAWALLAKYWTSDEYKKKRRRGQESRMSSDDPAQNRGGSRNFAETQQFLEFKFGRGQSGINTFAAMKSGVKNVDSTGRSAPIPSQKAQKRLDEYMALAPDANSQELDGKALYTIGRGMKHGRVPIGDGAVDKTTVLAHSKSGSIRPPDPDHYESVLKENAQLKMTNDILSEENRVHRELFMSVFDRIGIPPPAELVQRLEDLDARRHQATGSHGGSHLVDERRSNHIGDEEDDDDDDDYSYHESDDDDDDDGRGYHEGDDDSHNIDGDDDDACLEDDDGDDSSSSQSDDDHSTEQ